MKFALLAAGLAALVGFQTFPSSAHADDAKQTLTVVTIDGMHCPTCAKKVAGKLKTLAGVADVAMDVEKGTATVTPKKDSKPAPKDLWESIEKAGYKPTKLEGPDGVFEKKPA